MTDDLKKEPDAPPLSAREEEQVSSHDTRRGGPGRLIAFCLLGGMAFIIIVAVVAALFIVRAP